MRSMLELWMEIAKSFTPILIAALVAYVAVQQWLLAQARLKLDLFDRRFEVFQIAAKAIDASRMSAERAQGLAHLYDVMPASLFLFGSEVFDFLEKLAHSFDQPEGAEWLWLSAKLELRATFDPYLNFGTWRNRKRSF